MILKFAGIVLLTLGMTGVALATRVYGPEINAAVGMNALALLSGALLVIRSKKR
jgi:hypothetical protein